MPIGERLAIPPQPAFEHARQALSVIGSVHGDGDVPHLAVRLGRGAPEVGGYIYTAGGAARGLVISRLSPHPCLTFVQELGHVLDHQTLAVAGRFASETGRLVEVIESIERSAAIRALRSLVGRQRATVSRPRGRRERVAVNQPYVRYLLEPKEAFARAYAQYVAVRSNDPRLLAELELSRGDPLARQVYREQWTDEDFSPIGQALDRLLRRKGWIE